MVRTVQVVVGVVRMVVFLKGEDSGSGDSVVDGENRNAVMRE